MLVLITLVCWPAAAAAAPRSPQITFYFGLKRPSGVFARVSGTGAQFDGVFQVRITREFENDPNLYAYFLMGSGRLHLPTALRLLVRDVVPSYAHSATSPGARMNAARAAHASGPRRTGHWIRGCAKAKATGAFSFAQVRHAYGIDRPGAGAGASVAIFNLAEGVSSRDIADNARCFGYPRAHIRTLRVDGQTSAFRHGLFEPQEDLTLVRGMAPAMTSLTFSEVWGATGLWFLSASQVLSAAHLPDSFSISYGLCERDVRGLGSTPVTRAGANLTDAMLVRLGLAGVGSYASAGDSGSTCNGKPFPGVAWPGSSPFVTAVGGTRLTLTPRNQRRSEVVWNDLRWTSAKDGGGVVMSGYWEQDAGTSAAAPLVASAMAVLSADQRRRHRSPIGPANGLLYYLDGYSPTSIYDVTKGANGYLPEVPPRRAHRGYDLASGLGVPNFVSVAAALPSPGS